jgi:hypothetical protein
MCVTRDIACTSLQFDALLDQAQSTQKLARPISPDMVESVRNEYLNDVCTAWNGRILLFHTQCCIWFPRYTHSPSSLLSRLQVMDKCNLIE